MRIEAMTGAYRYSARWASQAQPNLRSETESLAHLDKAGGGVNGEGMAANRGHTTPAWAGFVYATEGVEIYGECFSDSNANRQRLNVVDPDRHDTAITAAIT